MSSRNRPRNSHNQDADEEKRLWNQIKDNAKKIDAMVARSAAIGHEIVDIEKQQAALLESNQPTSSTLDDRLEALYRENVKISETVQHIIQGNSDDMNLLDSIKILAGLREASEESAAQSRNTGKASRNASLPKRKATSAAKDGASVAGEDGEESAAPSPSVKSSRLGVQGRKEGRGGSVPSTREVSVKIEDGAESVASSVEGTRGSDPSGPSRSRPALNVGMQVFYRYPKNRPPSQEGEGILCRVTSVTGEGKQRRYEVQDADPDTTTPTPYKASIASLVPIPISSVGLPDLPRGKNVLAQYPDTTTFYKAEVSRPWKAGREEMVGLKFEGEETEVEREVERRFVLVEKGA